MFPGTRSDPSSWPAEVARFASQSPVKFVAVATLLVTGIVPALTFAVYVVGMVSCTVFAAVVLDVALLAMGLCGLGVAFCAVGCLTGGVVGIFSLFYLAYKTAAGGLKQAKGRFVPSTLSPTRSSPPHPAPTESPSDEPFDKHKFGGTIRLFVAFFANLLLPSSSSSSTSSSFGSRFVREELSRSSLEGAVDLDNDEEEGEEWQSDICRTSLIVLGLAFSIAIMSYTVLLATYLVVNFT